MTATATRPLCARRDSGSSSGTSALRWRRPALPATQSRCSVKALLECGASVDETNMYGASAFESTRFEGVLACLAEASSSRDVKQPSVRPAVGIWNDAEAMAV